uniref:MADF domain-containing protein n=1 Tax=Anopheles dirus TaxID=7168 RepID=A0A182N4Y5_9DIPT
SAGLKRCDQQQKNRKKHPARSLCVCCRPERDCVVLTIVPLQRKAVLSVGSDVNRSRVFSFLGRKVCCRALSTVAFKMPPHLKWSSETKLILIREIRKRPVLWQKDFPVGARWVEKTEAWHGVARVMRKPVADCQKAWISCRTMYRKLKRRIRASQAGGVSSTQKVTDEPVTTDDRPFHAFGRYVAEELISMPRRAAILLQQQLHQCIIDAKLHALPPYSGE